MREWIPLSTSAKGRVALVAIREFGRRPFDDVSVGELSSAAGVTTGVLYHHFGSKLGLYTFVRRDVEQRLFDRMEGARASVGGDPSAAANAALVVAFDFVVREELAHLLDVPPSRSEPDRMTEAVASYWPNEARAIASILVAAWRGALAAVAAGIDVSEVRSALVSISVDAAR